MVPGPRAGGPGQRGRPWEETAGSGDNSLVTALEALTDRIGLSDPTDSAGHATIRVGRGAWWVYARAWDVEDPNSEWYWNVRITGDTVRLDGTATQDPDGDRMLFWWLQTGGTTVELLNGFSSVASFAAPDTTETVTLTFRWTVIDGFGAVTQDVDVVVRP